MLQLRCLQRASYSRSKDLSHLPSSIPYRSVNKLAPLLKWHRPLTSHPQFSSGTSRQSRVLQSRSSAFTSPSRPWTLRQRIPDRLNGCSSVRFASTKLESPIVGSQPVGGLESNFTPPAATIVQEEFPYDAADNLTNEYSPQLGEYIGYLKDLGLDYGYGPTTVIETLLEYVHIYTGAPWWASIVIAAVIVRTLILKLYINSTDISAKMMAIKPMTEAIHARHKASSAAGDSNSRLKTAVELRALNKSAGIVYWKLLLPAVLQIPLGFGTVHLLRNMAHLPVPGFDTAGALWFSDLSVVDPTGILPIASAGVFYLTLMNGGDSGAMKPTMMKSMKVFLPGLMFLFSVFQPAAVQITFLTTSIFSLLQSYLFRQTWFRTFFGIQPLPDPTLTNPKKATTITVNSKSGGDAQKNKKETFVSELKSGWNSVQSKVDDVMQSQGLKPKNQTKRRTDAEIKHAKAYEEKRQREMAQQRFENAQAAAHKAEERRQRDRLR